MDDSAPMSSAVSSVSPISLYLFTSFWMISGGVSSRSCTCSRKGSCWAKVAAVGCSWAFRDSLRAQTYASSMRLFFSRLIISLSSLLILSFMPLTGNSIE